MSRQRINGENQIKISSIDIGRLKSNFLEGADWVIGANDATITGIRDGSSAQDVATYGQLQTAIASLQAQFGSGLDYKGVLDASDDTAFVAASHTKGDFYKITVAGTVAGVTVSVGDMVIVNKDVAAGAIVSGDIDVIDNSESADILKLADIVDNLSSTDTDKALSANQGKVLKDEIDTLATQVRIPVYGEVLAVTAGLPALPAFANTPIAGSQQVYLNGLRVREGAGNDYTISGSVVTFEYNLQAGDQVEADYDRPY
jgi:hypothetical protein